MSSKCFHTSHGIYLRGLYHSGSVLVLILLERVSFPPKNTKNLALKPLHRGTFGCKKGWATLQLCLPSVCTHNMRYIKEVCIIQEVPGYRYSKNKYLSHPRTPKIQLWNRYTEVRLAVKKDERHFNYVFQVFAHITWDIVKRFVSFRKCLDTDTPRTSIFPIPKHQKSCSETATQRYVWL